MPEAGRAPPDAVAPPSLGAPREHQALEVAQPRRGALRVAQLRLVAPQMGREKSEAEVRVERVGLRKLEG